MKEITTKNLLPGDVILCIPNLLKIDGWIGQAIVLISNGLASHTAVFCGNKEEIPTVAHSNLGGTHYDSLDYFTKNHAGFFVRRHRQNGDIDPVLSAIDLYMHNEKPDPYPIADLVLLGLLVLTKKFLHKTLINKIIYDFVVLLIVKLMEEINKRYYTESSMTCSQFAAQCFTDAKGYNIRFRKLSIQFGSFDGQKSSLFELLKEENGFNSLSKIMNLSDSYLQRKDEIADNFIKFMNGETGLPSETEIVSESDLSEVGATLLWILHKVQTGCEATSIKEVTKTYYTYRNYLVTPDDLLFNAINLKDIGFVGRKLF